MRANMNIEQFKHLINMLILEWLKYEDKEDKYCSQRYRAGTSQILKKVRDYLRTPKIRSAWDLS